MLRGSRPWRGESGRATEREDKEVDGQTDTKGRRSARELGASIMFAITHGTPISAVVVSRVHWITEGGLKAHAVPKPASVVRHAHTPLRERCGDRCCCRTHLSNKTSGEKQENTVSKLPSRKKRKKEYPGCLPQTQAAAGTLSSSFDTMNSPRKLDPLMLDPNDPCRLRPQGGTMGRERIPTRVRSGQRPPLSVLFLCAPARPALAPDERSGCSSCLKISWRFRTKTKSTREEEHRQRVSGKRFYSCHCASDIGGLAGSARARYIISERERERLLLVAIMYERDTCCYAGDHCRQAQNKQGTLQRATRTLLGQARCACVRTVRDVAEIEYTPDSPVDRTPPSF